MLTARRTYRAMYQIWLFTMGLFLLELSRGALVDNRQLSGRVRDERPMERFCTLGVWHQSILHGWFWLKSSGKTGDVLPGLGADITILAAPVRFYDRMASSFRRALRCNNALRSERRSEPCPATPGRSTHWSSSGPAMCKKDV